MDTSKNVSEVTLAGTRPSQSNLRRVRATATVGDNFVKAEKILYQMSLKECAQLLHWLQEMQIRSTQGCSDEPCIPLRDQRASTTSEYPCCCRHYAPVLIPVIGHLSSHSTQGEI